MSMAVSTGKRKRQEDGDVSKNGIEDEGAMRTLFQRAFEAKFRPLEPSTANVRETERDDETSDFEVDEESDWSGLSEDENLVETLRHDTYQHSGQDGQPHERRAFMSSKPPRANENVVAPSKNSLSAWEDEHTEATNVKHDLALQRLLKESHLLDPNSFEGSLTSQNGKGRLKALDLRLKDLGAKESATQQQKMPLSHRRGIAAKATDREERRRKDALENGVVVERPKVTSKAMKYREKGVGGPAIGKFRGGTLRLSSRDLRSIQGDKGKRRR